MDCYVKSSPLLNRAKTRGGGLAQRQVTLDDDERARGEEREENYLWEREGEGNTQIRPLILLRYLI